MGTGPSPITPSARCTVQADAEKTAFPPAGGSGTLRITTNRECAWSVTSQASWLSLTLPSEGQGEASVAFTVAANQDPTARSAGLAVNDREIRISQEPGPCQFTLSSMQETVDSLGGDRTIRVASSSPQCEWTARSDEGWIEIVEGREGRGPGTVTFRVGALSGDGRTGGLSIAGVPVRVEQSRQPPGPVACQVSIAPVSFTFGASGGTGEVHVTAAAGCAWPVESLASWITVRNRSASSGPGIVTFQVAATDGPARAAFLKIGSSVATIDQSPGCAFTVSPSSHTAPASGGVIAIIVTTAAGCSWTAASAAPWIATGEGGNAATGNGRLDLTVAPNPGPERSGTVLVAGRSITVTQPSGCRYDVSPPNLDAAAGGGAVTVAVATAAACPWTSVSHVPWLTSSTGSATGPAQLQVTASPNTGPPRTGTLTVAGRTLNVSQASPCTFSLNPSSSSVGGNGGPGLVLVFVTGPCTWTAATDAAWISLAESSTGTGSGFVNFSVAPNAGAARSATVTIAGVPHTVSQAAR